MKPYEAYRVGTDSSSLVSHGREGKDMRATMVINRDKYMEKPKVDAIKGRDRTYYTGDVVMGPTGEYDDAAAHRKRRDIIQEDNYEKGLLAPEGDVLNTGKNIIHPRKAHIIT